MSHITICYLPALDSFHISQSNVWGKDVHKVGSYCIFSYTHTFQDPCSKACVQCVHSEAVSFQHVSYNYRIPCNTPLHTYGSPCTWHSFWYKAWYTGTANRPCLLYITFWSLILTANVCHFLPHVCSLLHHLYFCAKRATRKQQLIALI
jgi:hypothetical protein